MLARASDSTGSQSDLTPVAAAWNLTGRDAAASIAKSPIARALALLRHCPLKTAGLF